MTTLADLVTISSRYARSANLERDTQAPEILHGYILTGRVIDFLHRFVDAADAGAGGTWSVTGPYGSGKSSLGVYLDALLGPANTTATTALELIAGVDDALAAKYRQLRATVGDRGFIRAVVTARSEPVTHSVTRALERAVRQYFGGMPTPRQFPAVKLLDAALSDLNSTGPRRTGPAPGSLLKIATDLAGLAPVLVVIDEFGKNLEAAQHRSDADLYLLQLLAEAAHTSRGTRLFLVTLQHLAFGEYAAGADTAQQREWTKIQGRFDDVVFVDSASQTRRLITRVFSVDATLVKQVATWARAQAKTMSALSLPEVADPELLANCYPMHPLTLAALPDLCRRYGQNERTLFGFLTGTSTAAVPSLLTTQPPTSPLPTIGLPEVYDYFVQATTSTTAGSTRWAEIGLRLRDLAGVSTGAMRMAKTIAVLNLITTTGPTRASRLLLASLDTKALAHLAELEDAGVIVYRDNTDEYRIWHGTGLRLAEIIERHRANASQRSPLALLNAAAPLGPVVATGHSLRTDTLRTFARRYTTDLHDIEALPASADHDGLLYIAITNDAWLPAIPPAGLPVVVQIPTAEAIDRLVQIAVDVHALQLGLAEPAVQDDWVARTEVSERLANASSQITAALDTALATGRWVLLTDDGPIDLPQRSTAAALSAACDKTYTHPVAVRNETLNRVELSSQGMKARRLLMLAMLDNEALPALGLTGNGPEVAMYRALLEHSGIHALDERHHRYTIRAPKHDPSLSFAWDIIDREIRSATTRRIALDDIYAALRLPPIGMKAGAIPILVTAVLIATSDEVAIYEHGTFKPVITEDVAERLGRNPGHFEVKHYATAAGTRQHLVEGLAERLEIRPRFRKQRVRSVLSVVADLVSRMAALPPYTNNADDLTPPAAAVRIAITSATEPDTLLFTTLPAALGLPPVPAGKATWDHTDSYLDLLLKALTELSGHYDRTLDQLFAELLTLAKEANRSALAAQAALIKDEILSPEVRSFVIAVAATEFGDHQWIEHIAAIVTRTAPKLWKPDDRRRYTIEIAGRLAAFRRLLSLHNEVRGMAGLPFTAMRFTVTVPSGREDAGLFGIDDHRSQQLDELLDPVLHQLADSLGISLEQLRRDAFTWAGRKVFDHVVTPIEHNDIPTLKPAVNNG